MSFNDLKLKYKISIVMAILLVSLSAAATFTQLSLFQKEYEEKSLAMAEEWADIGVKELDQLFTPIQEEVVTSVVDGNFKSTLFGIDKDDANNIPGILKIQQYLKNISLSSPYIRSTYILMDNGARLGFYTDFANNNSHLLDYETMKYVKGFQMIHSTKSPFEQNKDVIPVVFTFSRFNGSFYIAYDESTEPDFILVVLLDTNEIQKLFKNKTTQFSYTAQLNNGYDDIFPATDNNWKNTIRFEKDTTINGVKLVLQINRDTFMPMKRVIVQYAAIVTTLFSILGVASVFVISKSLTNPFKKITRMLARIKYNTYNFDEQPKYKDETGMLIAGINDMYLTIQENMEKIKIEETEKFKYLSQLLTEQINPHFIYNTLEMINMEVQSENLKSASEMINHFAMYLRTTLNNGQDITTIKTQLANVRAYYGIMNSRLNGSISLNINSDTSLDGILIPKAIMQPIVENCIKHGFDYARNIQEFILPEINIAISGDENEVIISISDNGKGIDIDETMRLMHSTTIKKHMGIANVYRRLKIYDENSDIEVFSVPYFKNEFRITFHPRKS